MNDIFDKLEKNISENKNKSNSKKEKTAKLWSKYYAEEKKIQKELGIEKDLIKLEKFLNKHIDNDNIKVRRSINNHLTVEYSISLPDGYSTTGVKMEYNNSKELDYHASDPDLEKYKHSKDSYVIHVKLLGDPDIDYVYTENVREEKIFKMKDKEKAYEYFNDLFQVRILHLDN
ncbi:hypothetical protein [Candidatus Pelagibacter sp. HIMB1709]|uniref:hypothetical protein n=1 Tax=Candidatus Pelagibacter sp. HIMB1709 TaxID=3413367 RepID=UPI003F85C5BF